MPEALLIVEDDRSLTLDCAAARRLLAQFGADGELRDDELAEVVAELLKLPLNLKK